MTYIIGPTLREVLRDLEEIRRARMAPDGSGSRYTSIVGVSDEPDTIPLGPVAPAYSRTAGPLRTHGSKS